MLLQYFVVCCSVSYYRLIYILDAINPLTVPWTKYACCQATPISDSEYVRHVVDNLTTEKRSPIFCERYEGVQHTDGRWMVKHDIQASRIFQRCHSDTRWRRKKADTVKTRTCVKRYHSANGLIRLDHVLRIVLTSAPPTHVNMQFLVSAAYRDAHRTDDRWTVNHDIQAYGKPHSHYVFKSIISNKKRLQNFVCNELSNTTMRHMQCTLFLVIGKCNGFLLFSEVRCI